MYPHLSKQPFYIAGESFGGQYVPQLATDIVRENKAGVQPHINLVAISLGNAWVNPYVQVGAWLEFAVENQLVGSTSASIMRMMNSTCVGALASHAKFDELVDCYGILATILAENPGMEVGL
jgi:carboxypeptidase D